MFINESTVSILNKIRSHQELQDSLGAMPNMSAIFKPFRGTLARTHTHKTRLQSYLNA